MFELSAAVSKLYGLSRALGRKAAVPFSRTFSGRRVAVEYTSKGVASVVMSKRLLALLRLKLTIDDRRLQRLTFHLKSCG